MFKSYNWGEFEFYNTSTHKLPRAIKEQNNNMYACFANQSEVIYSCE